MVDLFVLLNEHATCITITINCKVSFPNFNTSSFFPRKNPPDLGGNMMILPSYSLATMLDYNTGRVDVIEEQDNI